MQLLNTDNDQFEKLAECQKVNQQFMQLVRFGDPQELKKFAQEYGNAWIKVRLRERAVMRKLLMFGNVTVSDRNVQRNTLDDTLVYMKDIEPFSRAASVVTIRGRGEAQYIEGKRYAIPFAKFVTPLFMKDENELLAYDLPLNQIIEENSAKDLEEKQDAIGFAKVNQIIADRETLFAGSAKVTGNGEITKEKILDLFNLLDQRRLVADALVMTWTSYNSFLKQTLQTFGDPLLSEIIQKGYTYDRILGRKVYISVKNDIIDVLNSNGSGMVTKRRVYAFAAPRYLGDFKVLNDTKFYIENRFGTVMSQLSEMAAIGFGNIHAMACLEMTV